MLCLLVLAQVLPLQDMVVPSIQDDGCGASAHSWHGLTGTTALCPCCLIFAPGLHEVAQQFCICDACAWSLHVGCLCCGSKCEAFQRLCCMIAACQLSLLCYKASVRCAAYSLVMNKPDVMHNIANKM